MRRLFSLTLLSTLLITGVATSSASAAAATPPGCSFVKGTTWCFESIRSSFTADAQSRLQQQEPTGQDP